MLLTTLPLEFPLLSLCRVSDGAVLLCGCRLSVGVAFGQRHSCCWNTVGEVAMVADPKSAFEFHPSHIARQKPDGSKSAQHFGGKLASWRELKFK